MWPYGASDPRSVWITYSRTLLLCYFSFVGLLYPMMSSHVILLKSDGLVIMKQNTVLTECVMIQVFCMFGLKWWDGARGNEICIFVSLRHPLVLRCPVSHGLDLTLSIFCLRCRFQLRNVTSLWIWISVTLSSEPAPEWGCCCTPMKKAPVGRSCLTPTRSRTQTSTAPDRPPSSSMATGPRDLRRCGCPTLQSCCWRGHTWIS